MRVAVTGAHGSVGQEVVKLAAKHNWDIIEIDRTERDANDHPFNEKRTADISGSYEETVKAFKGADAVIHLAAIPNPVDKEDSLVHSSNVNAAFNGFRAAAELGIKRICYASSVNAIGLAFSNQPNEFDYFPIDEDYAQRPTDSYALAKQEAETQARAFVRWFPFVKIACLRIHQVAPRQKVQDEHQKDPETALKQLWGWVSPEATARACMQAVENADNFEGAEIFNIVAPTTTQSVSSSELAREHYPKAEIRAGMEGNNAFWTTMKAREILKWEHREEE
ncbi:UDP-galactose 4-epimerase [Lecanosticta acicola]|uniref:UDP-galactose 4-epimerase n=1 Tax=Lecanosticta acicola TaxID=111012 RepID=A0AAI8YWC6_9PEZI|nr:UDP-galactose 4-epimerase [Lecanosticta acicola]